MKFTMHANPVISFFPFARKVVAMTSPLLLVLILLTHFQTVRAQQPDKKIGFSIQVGTDGYFSSTIAKVAVTQVNPDSQALAAGVVVGDEIVKIQEITVPGNNASKLKEHLDFVPGVPKKVTFKRANGSKYEVVFRRAVAPKADG